MFFNGNYYYDKCLPQGCASSCQIFEKFSTAIQTIFNYYHPEANCIHMLDDFLILAEDFNTCQKHLQALLDLCQDIGVPMSPEKTTNPSTQTTFLGIELDTQSRSAKLPPDKLEEYSNLVEHYLLQKKIRRSQLESLIGKLNFASSVVPARPFLRRMVELMNPSQKPLYFIPLTSEVKNDLQTWRTFLQSYNGKTFFRSIFISTPQDLLMASDASQQGFGACFDASWIQAKYPPRWNQYHITVLEMDPIYVMIAMFGRSISNTNVLFKTIRLLKIF